MTAPRIYYPRAFTTDGIYVLERSWRHYLQRVLRLREGDTVILFDGDGKEGEASITEATAAGIRVRVDACRSVPTNQRPLTLAQALPKGSTMDAIIRKATELGATAILPFAADRSIPRLTPEKARQKVDRWHTIAVEACRQSRRSETPCVGDIVSFPDMIAASPVEAVRLILWEEERDTGLGDLLRKRTSPQGDAFFVVIGPEGGFTDGEVRLAKRQGFLAASLGRRILKVETAAVAVLAIIQYERMTLGTPGQGGTPE